MGSQPPAIASQPPPTSAFRSRTGRGPRERIALAGPRNDPTGYVERLVDVLRAGNYDIVLAGTEPALITISEGREQIEQHARLGLPAHETLLASLDKPLLQRRAERAGLTPPASVVCSSLAEMEVAVRELGFPLVVKPAVSLTRTNGYLRHQTARVVENAKSLEAVATEWPLTIQQYVPGARIVSCAGVRAGGELLGLTVTRYERTYRRRSGAPRSRSRSRRLRCSASASKHCSPKSAGLESSSSSCSSSKAGSERSTSIPDPLAGCRSRSERGRTYPQSGVTTSSAAPASRRATRAQESITAGRRRICAAPLLICAAAACATRQPCCGHAGMSFTRYSGETTQGRWSRVSFQGRTTSTAFGCTAIGAGGLDEISGQFEPA